MARSRGDLPGCLESLCAWLPAGERARDDGGSGSPGEAQHGLVSGQRRGEEDWRRLRLYGARLRAGLVALVLCSYLCFVALCWGPRVRDGEAAAIALVAIFHVPVANLVSALYLTVSTDPGPVPRSFRQPGKKTCTVCQVQKPDRCHHCSVCGRCVLNMDHHCLYVNACIGFHNRKFFCQLLFHGLSCVLFVVFGTVPELVRRLAELGDPEVPRGPAFWCGTAAVLLSWAVLAVAAYPFGLFTLYHFRAVVRNSTTIEDMQNGDRHQSPYDNGWGQNLMQVFGAQFPLWLLPVRCQWLAPLGDGMTWRKNTGQVRPTAPHSSP